MKSAKPRKRYPVNPVDVLATSMDARDNMRVGMIAAPRKVLVTERESIARQFTAPRLDMGEYVPVSTHNVEMEKMEKYGKDWTL